MFTSTSRSRRHRNVVEEQKTDTQPFFARPSGMQAKKDPTFFQAKLTVGKPNDRYEKEADTVANSVVNHQNSHPAVQQKKISSIQRLTSGEEEEKISTNDARMRKDKEIQTKPILQRMCADCEKEKQKTVQRMETGEPKEEEKLQRKSDGSTATASPAISNRIESSSGNGKGLPAKTLSDMNSSFGADFSKVNIHTGTDAIQMNRELNAQAFTHGRDIYFNAGKFDYSSTQGKQLLAHELTHVVQQGHAPHKSIQRSPDKHDLKSDRFKGDSDLESCYDDEARLTRNNQGLEGKRKIEKGPAVKKINDALVELEYLMPPVNDVYTEATWEAIKKLKADKELGWEHMGDVGPGTMKWLDDHFTTKNNNNEDPPKDQKLCGPDVTTQVKEANIKTRKKFAQWPAERKASACQALVHPFWALFAWDIVDLNESGWIHKDYGPICATEGADPSCMKSIEVDKKCFYAGSVNYVHFGNMFDLCERFYSSFPLNKQFSQNEMLKWIDWWKGKGVTGLQTPSKNFKASVDWASAGFFNWPHGALTPDADRPDCKLSCPTAYKGKEFKVNWDGENF